MNIDYLVEEVLPQRAKEIAEGKNCATRQPIYVVLSLIEHCCSGHNDYSMNTNYKGINAEFGYIDTSADPEDRKFNESDSEMIKPEAVTKYYTDSIIAFFLTSQAAHDYLKYQSHNLNDGYVYVFYSGYRNIQMDKLLNNG